MPQQHYGGKLSNTVADMQVHIKGMVPVMLGLLHTACDVESKQPSMLSSCRGCATALTPSNLLSGV